MTHAAALTTSRSGSISSRPQPSSGVLRRAAGVVGALAILGTIVGLSATPAMAATAQSAVSMDGLDVQQAVAFDPAATSRYGFVRSITFGSTTLFSDLVSTDPTQQPIARLDAAGVLNSIQWQGGPADPLTLQFMVSSANKRRLETWLSTDPNRAVKFSFRVYEFDLVRNRWFESFFPVNNGVLSGSVASDAELQFAIGANNNNLWLVAVNLRPPATITQALVQQTAAQAGTLLRSWGIGPTAGAVTPKLTSWTAVSCSPNPAVYPGTTTCTATVSGGASISGSVSWGTGYFGRFSPATCTLSAGRCSVTYTPGSRDVGQGVVIAAVYSGDAEYSSSEGKTTVTVTKAAT